MVAPGPPVGHTPPVPPVRIPRVATSTRSRRGPNGQLLTAAVLLTVLGAMALAPGLFTRADPRDCSLSRSLDRPGWGHPFGYDVFGCDYLAQTVHGARASMVLAVSVVLATAVLAGVVGALAGYSGGLLDGLISRVTDVWSGIPLILGGVVLLSATDERGIPQVAAVLVLFSWPPMVRVMRASTQQVTELDYVTAARALGAGRVRLLLRYVVPNAVRPLVVFASAYAGVVIATEAVLTFAGIGLQRPTQSWGIQLYQAQDRLAQAPHLLAFPGLFLVAAVLGFVLLGEGLRRRSAGRG